MTRFFTAACLALFTFSSAFAQADADPLAANQWVQPTEAGTFTGRVILPSGDGMARAIEGASVTITSVDGGEFSGQAVTDGMGEFTVGDVTPGVYVISASAANAYYHAAIHVIDSSSDLGGRFPNVAEISAANMNYEAVNSTINRYRPPSSKRVITMATADLDALADRIITDDTYRVSQFDGGINGRLYAAGADGPNLSPSPMTNVFIMRNGIEVGRAVTNELGDFRIDNLPVGNYSLLAIGRDGMAAIGFELVAEGGGDVARRTSDGKQFVSAARAIGSFNAQLAPFGEDGDDEETDDVADAEPLMDPFGGLGQDYTAGGGFGPGGGSYYGGGGGGAGGGGGLGGISGLAGIGGLIAAASGGSGGGANLGPAPPAASGQLPGNVPPQFDQDENGVPDFADFDNFPGNPPENPDVGL